MNKILELKIKDRKTGKESISGKLEIKNQAADSADLYFYGDIVSSEWGKWDDTDKCPTDVQTFLKDIEGVKNLNIYVNSGGGSVFAGLAIYNMLKRHQGFKTVYVDGVAASIASVIALAGDKVIIPSNAFLMIHKPWDWTWGANATELRKMADTLDRIEEGIMNVYKGNLKEGVDIETIRQMVQEETWLNGEEAAKYFNVEVGETSQAAACTSSYFDRYNHIPANLKKQEEPGEENKTNIEKEKLLLELDLL